MIYYSKLKKTYQEKFILINMTLILIKESEDFNIDMLASTILASITKRNPNNNTSHFIPLEK